MTLFFWISRFFEDITLVNKGRLNFTTTIGLKSNLSIDMADDLPDIVISRAAGSEYILVLPCDIANAAVDGAAVNGHLLAACVFQNHIRTHSNIVFAFIHREIDQNIGVLHQISFISEHRICYTLLIGVVGLGIIRSQNQRLIICQIIRPRKHGAVFQQLITTQTTGGKIILLVLLDGSDHPDTLLTGDTDRATGVLQDVVQFLHLFRSIGTICIFVQCPHLHTDRVLGMDIIGITYMVAVGDHAARLCSCRKVNIIVSSAALNSILNAIDPNRGTDGLIHDDSAFRTGYSVRLGCQGCHGDHGNDHAYHKKSTEHFFQQSHNTSLLSLFFSA